MTLLYPVKRKLKANSKPWFKKRDKLHMRYINSGLETNKGHFKTAKIFLQKMLHGIMENIEVSWFKFEGKEYVKTFAE